MSKLLNIRPLPVVTVLICFKIGLRLIDNEIQWQCTLYQYMLYVSNASVGKNITQFSDPMTFFDICSYRTVFGIWPLHNLEQRYMYMISVDIEMKLWQISVPVSIQNSNDFAPYFTYKMAHGLFKMVKSAFLYDVILKHIILNSSINTRTTCI